MASSINTAIPPLGNPTTSGVRSNFTAAKNEIEALQVSLQESLSMMAYQYITNTGGNKYVSATRSGPTITFPDFYAIVQYTDGAVFRTEEWKLDAQTITPYFAGGALQQISYLGIVPDFTTKNTTKSLMIITRSLYRDFTPLEIAGMCAYVPLNRDLNTLALTSSTFNMLGDKFASPHVKVTLFLNGPEKIGDSSYKLTAEATNFGGAIGSYFSMEAGSSLTAGRNSSKDENSTYLILDDPHVQGAGGTNTIAVGSRFVGNGNSGQSLYRVTNGRVLSGQVPMYEPTPAATEAAYVNVAANNWCSYKLLVYPNSLTVVMCPDSTTYSSAALAIAGAHIYDTQAVRSLDRFLPCVDVGYLVLRGTFNPLLSWTSNAGLYLFYDTRKIAY